jgi:hypothetical protein
VLGSSGASQTAACIGCGAVRLDSRTHQHGAALTAADNAAAADHTAAAAVIALHATAGCSSVSTAGPQCDVCDTVIYFRDDAGRRLVEEARVEAYGALAPSGQTYLHGSVRAPRTPLTDSDSSWGPRCSPPPSLPPPWCGRHSLPDTSVWATHTLPDTSVWATHTLPDTSVWATHTLPDTSV